MSPFIRMGLSLAGQWQQENLIVPCNLNSVIGTDPTTPLGPWIIGQTGGDRLSGVICNRK